MDVVDRESESESEVLNEERDPDMLSESKLLDDSASTRTGRRRACECLRRA